MFPISWASFPEKGPFKITEGGPHWLISRINPASEDATSFVGRATTVHNRLFHVDTSR